MFRVISAIYDIRLRDTKFIGNDKLWNECRVDRQPHLNLRQLELHLMTTHRFRVSILIELHFSRDVHCSFQLFVFD